MKSLLKASLATALISAGLMTGASANHNPGHTSCAKACPKACHKGGFMIGVNVAYAVNEAAIRRTYIPTPAATDRHNIVGRGFGGGLNVGYGFHMGRMFVAPEVGANFMSARARFTNNPSAAINESVRVRLTDLYTAGINAGMRFRGVFPFLRMGWANSRFKVDSTSANTPDRMSRSKRLSGFDVGVGVGFPLSDKVVFGVDYSHVWYGRMTVTHDNTATFRVRPQTDTLWLRFKYKL